MTSTDQSTTYSAPQESGLLETAIAKLGGWTLGTALAPLWILFTDNSLSVRGRARTENAKEIPGKTFAILAFPFLAVFILMQLPVYPVWLLPAIAPLAWLALAKRIPARSFTDFSTIKIIGSIKSLSKITLIISGLFMVVAYVTALGTDQAALGGLLAVLSGYPAAYTLGRDRNDNVVYESTQVDGYRRMMGIILGLSESQAAELRVFSTGKNEHLRISASKLSIDAVKHLPGAKIAIETHFPEWMIIEASADIVTIGVATPDVIEQRQRLAASGGIISSITAEDHPAAGGSFQVSQHPFDPNENF